MHLNNKIRRDVAIGLAKKAVAKHGEALTNQFTELNKKFWSQHKMNVQKILLDLHSAHWIEPMAMGVMTSTTQSEAAYSYVDNGGVKRTGQFENYDVSEGDVSALSSLFDMPEYMKIAKLIWRGHNETLMRLRFTTDTPLPRINKMGEFEEDSELAIKCMAAISNLKSICKAFIDTYKQIYGVVLATKSDKQLLELLPEAKEFLPPPAPKERKELVPAEYVNKLRERIAAGVPDKLGV